MQHNADKHSCLSVYPGKELLPSPDLEGGKASFPDPEGGGGPLPRTGMRGVPVRVDVGIGRPPPGPVLKV